MGNRESVGRVLGDNEFTVTAVLGMKAVPSHLGQVGWVKSESGKTWVSVER